MRRSVRATAPAKVNLILRVLGREASGYHALETVFCGISLADVVEVRESTESGIAFVASGAVEMGPPERNLVVRAAERFYHGLGEEPRVRIALEKRIPAGAGLGGGSSDAAATLLALNEFHGRPLPSRTLMRWGGELGSDVGFFLCGGPLALGWSRGERLLPLPPLPPLPILVAHPGTPIAPPEAFRRHSERRGESYAPPAAVLALPWPSDWEAIGDVAENDFLEPAVEIVPAIGEGLKMIRDAGAIVALLAGSGSSIFGIFDRREAAEAVEPSLVSLGFRCWHATTLDRLARLDG